MVLALNVVWVSFGHILASVVCIFIAKKTLKQCFCPNSFLQVTIF